MSRVYELVSTSSTTFMKEVSPNFPVIKWTSSGSIKFSEDFLLSLYIIAVSEADGSLLTGEKVATVNNVERFCHIGPLSRAQQKRPDFIRMVSPYPYFYSDLLIRLRRFSALIYNSTSG